MSGSKKPTWAERADQERKQRQRSRCTDDRFLRGLGAPCGQCEGCRKDAAPREPLDEEVQQLKTAQAALTEEVQQLKAAHAALAAELAQHKKTLAAAERQIEEAERTAWQAEQDLRRHKERCRCR